MLHPALLPVRRLIPVVLVLLASLPGRAMGAGASPAAVSAAVRGDFNGDGFSDLAAGVPGDDSAESNAGAVNVIRGGPRGLIASGNQLWTEDTPGLSSSARTGEGFGSALAVGDFNGDGFSDLAVGAPRDVVGGTAAGAVVVLYGSPAGLRQVGSDQWTQDSFGVPGHAARNNLFGATLASGDCNAAGFADLAVSAPQEQVGGKFSAGSVTVLFGSPAGLRGVGSRMFTQASPGIAGRPGTLHLFGWSLAAADFGRGRARDLAAGVPPDTGDGRPRAGSGTGVHGAPERPHSRGDRRGRGLTGEAGGNRSRGRRGQRHLRIPGRPGPRGKPPVDQEQRGTRGSGPGRRALRRGPRRRAVRALEARGPGRGDRTARLAPGGGSGCGRRPVRQLQGPAGRRQPAVDAHLARHLRPGRQGRSLRSRRGVTS